MAKSKERRVSCSRCGNNARPGSIVIGYRNGNVDRPVWGRCPNCEGVGTVPVKDGRGHRRE